MSHIYVILGQPKPTIFTPNVFVFLFLHEEILSWGKSPILCETYSPARSSMQNVVPQHSTARGLLCWYPPAVDAAGELVASTLNQR